MTKWSWRRQIRIVWYRFFLEELIIFHLYGKTCAFMEPEIYHRTLPLDRILSRLNSVYTIKPCFLRSVLILSHSRVCIPRGLFILWLLCWTHFSFSLHSTCPAHLCLFMYSRCITDPVNKVTLDLKEQLAEWYLCSAGLLSPRAVSPTYFALSACF